MVKWISLAILALPVLEIVVFIAVAASIGVLWAFALLLSSSVLGALVLRHAGRAQVARFRAAVSNGERRFDDQGASLLTVLAGLLLLLPGFITDIFGLALLIKPVQRWCVATFMGSLRAGPARREGVVDLDPDEWKQVPDRELDNKNRDPRRD
jgi:UPF0716 protein FxsA